jgi:hypothetical protein
MAKPISVFSGYFTIVVTTTAHAARMNRPVVKGCPGVR